MNHPTQRLARFKEGLPWFSASKDNNLEKVESIPFGIVKLKNEALLMVAPSLQKGHVASMYKIIGADQKEYGPISADQLRQWISEGRINAQTRVLPVGGTEWKTMAELPEFAMVLPRPAPPLPPRPIGLTLPEAGKTSQMAVWSMVTGIISILCCFCGAQIISPVSIILGAVALSQLKQHPEMRGSGFAIAGIVLGAISLVMLIASVVYIILNPGALQNLQNALPQT